MVDAMTTYGEWEGGDPFENYDLNNYDIDDIEAYLKLNKKNIINELSTFTKTELKVHLRKSKIKKLNKKSWKFW